MKNHPNTPQFTHFLRNWSESTRTIEHNFAFGSKHPIFLSTFISNAEKVRKTTCFCDVPHKFPNEMCHKSNGLLILFPFIPNNL